MRIGVDLLGSDSSPESVLAACVRAAEDLGEAVTLIPFGKSEGNVCTHPSLHYHEVVEEITMEDPPLQAVRRKKGASLVVGMQQLAKGELDGFVSAGNTGALLAAATLRLPLLPGVGRPALLALLPTLTGSVAVLDIGANVVCKTQHMLQFARMGAAYKRCSEGIDRPRIGLLNIGTEAIKGTAGVKETYNALAGLDTAEYEFVGNIEGREAFSGVVDVLVCDGFAGNIFLKTAEGISTFILQHLGKEFGDERAPAVDQALESLNRKVNYAEYPGAIICGVDGVVVKCHGFSSERAIVNGIKGAVQLVSNGLIPRLREALSPHQVQQ